MKTTLPFLSDTMVSIALTKLYIELQSLSNNNATVFSDVSRYQAVSCDKAHVIESWRCI